MKIVGAPGLVVEGGRQAADVPAVAHRDQRQHRDLRRARPRAGSPGARRAGTRRAASGSGSSYQSAWVTNCCSGMSSASRSRTEWSDTLLLLVGDDLLGDRHDPERAARRRRSRGARAPARCRSPTPSSAGCTSRPRTAARARGAGPGRGPRPRRRRPCAGRPRPGGPAECARADSTLPITSPPLASTMATESGRGRAQGDPSRRVALAARHVAPAALAQAALLDQPLGVLLPARAEDRPRPPA